MNTKIIYRVAGLSLIFLFFLGMALMLFEKYLDRPHLKDQAPPQSPRSQVEFESGQLRQSLEARQRRELEIDRDLSDGYRQIPIERAMVEIAKRKTLEPKRLFGRSP